MFTHPIAKSDYVDPDQQRLRESDQKALKAILMLYHSDLCRVAYRVSRDEEKLNDVVQEVFLNYGSGGKNLTSLFHWELISDELSSTVRSIQARSYTISGSQRLAFRSLFPRFTLRRIFIFRRTPGLRQIKQGIVFWPFRKAMTEQILLSLIFTLTRFHESGGV